MHPSNHALFEWSVFRFYKLHSSVSARWGDARGLGVIRVNIKVLARSLNEKVISTITFQL